MSKHAEGMRRGLPVLALALFAAALVAACGTNGAVLQPPPAASEQGKATETLYQVVFIIGAAVFFLVEALILFAAFRYRRRKNDDGSLPPQIHGSNVLEVIWTAIPIAIVAFLFIFSWQTLNTVNAVSPDPQLKVEVTGFQWEWQFTYPDQGITIVGLPDKHPDLVVPVNTVVQVQLQSRDVIHAFYVPAFLFKRDAIPGRTNVFDFTPTEIGTFSGQCTQFCGLQHWNMQFAVRVVSPADFDAWVAQAQATPTPAPPTPTPAASSSGGPAASGSVAPAALGLTAQNIAFDKTELSAPANTPIQLTFVNNDAGIPHDVSIRKDSATGDAVFTGDIVIGVATKVYDLPSLPAGTYAFVCTVHPTMVGTLTVK
jgi:cytochrome c oxidase subunit II